MRAFRTSSQALVTIDKEFWWSWRELNPHPKVFNFMKLKMFILKDIYT